MPLERPSSNIVASTLNSIVNIARNEAVISAIRRVSKSSPENSDAAFSSSLAFLALSKYVTTETFLGLLKEHWRSVKQVLMNPKIVEEWRGMRVTCADGLKANLESTFLPTEELKLYNPSLPFLPISDPNNPDWNFLERFGVALRFNANSCLKLIVNHASNNDGEIDTMYSLYQRLEAVITPNSDEFRAVR